MDNYLQNANENVNTLNLPKKSYKTFPFALQNENAENDSSINNNKAQNVYLLSIAQNKDILYNDFDVLVKQIIDNQKEDFLNGEANLIEYLLTKNLNISKNQFASLKNLNLKVNETFKLFDDLGRYLFNLQDLNLKGSRIESIDTLGTNFKNLIKLNISNCFLNDLSGK